MHYCLFSFFIFSLLATSSIKLNLNLNLNGVVELFTEIKTFSVAGLQYEGQHGYDGEETAWKDEVDDVVERLATKMERETDACVRSVTAIVLNFRLPCVNACQTNNNKMLSYRRETALQGAL